MDISGGRCRSEPVALVRAAEKGPIFQADKRDDMGVTVHLWLLNYSDMVNQCLIYYNSMVNIWLVDMVDSGFP